MRGSVEEAANDVEIDLNFEFDEQEVVVTRTGADDLLSFGWQALALAQAGRRAAGVGPDNLERIVKNVDDFIGCDVLSSANLTEHASLMRPVDDDDSAPPSPSNDGEGPEAPKPERTTNDEAVVAEVLACIQNEEAWSVLPTPTMKKTFRMRQAIDRRFSGAKNKRTRDFSGISF